MSRRSRRAVAAVAAGAIAIVTTAGCAQSRAAGTTGTTGTTSSADCQTQQQNAGLTVQFTTVPCPAKGGTATTARFTVKDSAGAVVPDATVKVDYDMPSMDMRGAPQTATRKGDAYESTLVLGMSGHWAVTVQISRPSGPPAAVRFDVKAR
ncbi:FixH family protein [Streptosporangium longisporum]|uniref:YtkA-like domain-containing protein n=1 Tax=Streptosporangium longisporum TaxID=46187 RepID=A0ABN3YBZ0_9ACTN